MTGEWDRYLWERNHLVDQHQDCLVVEQNLLNVVAALKAELHSWCEILLRLHLVINSLIDRARAGGQAVPL